MCGVVLTVWPLLWMPHYLLGFPPIKCCRSNQSESHLLKVGPHCGTSLFVRSQTATTPCGGESKTDNTNKHIFWQSCMLFFLPKFNFLVFLGRVKQSIKPPFIFSPLRLGLPAWCEGLDQMASQHKALGHMGRQYVECSYIFSMLCLCLPGC